jgi:hypothetical protein
MPKLSLQRTAGLTAALCALAFGLLFAVGRTGEQTSDPARAAEPASAPVLVPPPPAVEPLRTVAALPGLRPGRGKRSRRRAAGKPEPAAPAPAVQATPREPVQDGQSLLSTQTAPPTPTPVPVPIPRPTPKPSRPPADTGSEFDDSG